MSMTPAQRKQVRAKYEQQDKERKNKRLGISPKISKKTKRK